MPAAGGYMKRFFVYVLLSAASASGQTAPPAVPAGEVLGPGNFIHAVSNLDNSMDFYVGVIGLDLQRGRGGSNGAPPPPPVVPRPFIKTPEILRLYNAGDNAQYRAATAMIQVSPMRAELVEFNGVELKPVKPRLVDPGASIFILTVKDLDGVMERVKKSGTPVVTAGGEPVMIDGEHGKIRAVVVKDPDGFFIELVQPQTLPDSAGQFASNVIDVGFGFTVENTDRMVHVFKDGLGFTPQTRAFSADPARLSLAGAPKGSQVRRTTAYVPGSSLQVEFLEFKGVDGKPVHGTQHDPGAAVLRLRIRDMDSMVKSLKGVGVKVVSAGGEPVFIGNPANGQRAAITGAPDNLFVQLLLQPLQAQ